MADAGAVLRDVVIVGGGRMGSGIAHAFVMNKCVVTVVEAGEAAAARAVERVRSAVVRSCEKSDLGIDPEEAMSEFSVIPDIRGLARDADLVIEAVPEDVTLKTALLQDVETVVSPDTLIASNTSSLSITELAGVLEHPERFLGMHFFNPVPVSLLVELVVGRQTSGQTVQKGEDIARSLGKSSIVVQDSPGFATSRLGLVVGLEAMRMLQDGVAGAQDIDQAMVLGYRHPIGPLRLTDLVGLDVRLAVAEHLFATLGPRFEPPPILRDMVAAGKLGKKSGGGFYVWEQ